MNDSEWYNYLKANFKPTKGTAYFFDLADCHEPADLKPKIVKGLTKLRVEVRKCASTHFKFAYIKYLDDEIEYFFSKNEIQKEENLSLGKVMKFRYKIALDEEELKKELAELASFLKNSQAG